MRAYPCSGEINFHVENTAATIDRVVEYFANDAIGTDRTDGISMEFERWRFNLRGSNTEPLLRLNVESRADQALMEDRTAYISDLISRH